jgi:hypothetical protein
MGHIWRVVKHPDESLCVGHRYEEEARPSCRVWDFMNILFMCQFMSVLVFSHMLMFPFVAVGNMAFSVAVLSLKSSVMTSVHIVYCVMSVAYAALFHDFYMFCLSMTYIIANAISLKMTDF